MTRPSVGGCGFAKRYKVYKTYNNHRQVVFVAHSATTTTITITTTATTTTITTTTTTTIAYITVQPVLLLLYTNLRQ